MSAYGKAVSLFATLGAIGLFPVPAAAGTDGIVCNDPAIARHLARVIARPAVFRDRLHGYLEVGYCVTVDTELLGLRKSKDEKRSLVRYAIIPPQGRLHVDE